MPEELRVLVVEDDPVAAEAHRAYVDLVLLDMHLPDGHGLDVVRWMRARGNQTDVVAVTSAREVAPVQAAARIGVVQYLLEPFAFDTLRDRPLAYARQRRAAATGRTVADQDEVDRLLRPATIPSVPKGLAGPVLDRVVRLLGDRAGWTAEGGVFVGVGELTARRGPGWPKGAAATPAPRRPCRRPTTVRP